jgi:hypothetical protein
MKNFAVASRSSRRARWTPRQPWFLVCANVAMNRGRNVPRLPFENAWKELVLMERD